MKKTVTSVLKERSQGGLKQSFVKSFEVFSLCYRVVLTLLSVRVLRLL